MHSYCQIVVIHQLYCYNEYTAAAVLLLQSVYCITLLLQSVLYNIVMLYHLYIQCTAAAIPLPQSVYYGCCTTATISVLQQLYYYHSQCTAAAVLLLQSMYCSCYTTTTVSVLRLLYSCYNHYTAATSAACSQCTVLSAQGSRTVNVLSAGPLIISKARQAIWEIFIAWL